MYLNYIIDIIEYMKRPIPYEGLEGYSVTETGEVIGRDGVTKISQKINSKGYRKVSLYVTGVGKRTFSAHRIVAMAFVPTDDYSMDVDHIDNDRLNNHASNLQWLSRSDNVLKSFRQGRTNPRKGQISGVLKGFYITHENVELLKGVDNKSRFINMLIDGYFQPKAPWREKIEKPFVDAGMFNPSPEKIASDPSGEEGVFNTPEDIILKDEQWEEKYTDGELPCCKQKTRCKHWEWDGATLEYVNSLSGKRKIAE